MIRGAVAVLNGPCDVALRARQDPFGDADIPPRIPGAQQTPRITRPGWR